jgi:hypothetical protein
MCVVGVLLIKQNKRWNWIDHNDNQEIHNYDNNINHIVVHLYTHRYIQKSTTRIKVIKLHDGSHLNLRTVVH